MKNIQTWLLVYEIKIRVYIIDLLASVAIGTQNKAIKKLCQKMLITENSNVENIQKRLKDKS